MRTLEPLRVAVIDLDEPIVDLDCRRAERPPYVGAWVLARRRGRPVGAARLPCSGPSIPASALERALRDELGDSWDPRPGSRVGLEAAPLPSASVVIPTAMSRSDQLERCLRTLRLLDYPAYEVIVVDNRRAGIPPMALSGARVVHEPRPGISAARNRGLSVASGEIIAFTDDDVEVDRGWLRGLGERFAREPRLAALSGMVLPAQLETPAQLMFEQSGGLPERGYHALSFELAGRFRVRCRDLDGDGVEHLHSLYQTGKLGTGSNMAFRASELRAAGGFDVALGTGTPTKGGEDLAMLVGLLAQGRQLGYEPGAIVHHTHRATMPELERQMYGYGLGFTAMLTALALRYPLHLLGLAGVVPLWLRSRRDPSSAKQVNRTEQYPPSLARAERRGMLAGPPAYLRSRLTQSWWSPC